ncbi:MAG: site-specific DNA-methyltransferase [Anaerolineales bacterium]
MLDRIRDPDILEEKQGVGPNEINRLDQRLFQRLESKFLVQPSLSRLLVSFQANKTRPIYRWYKFKEAFSASLVEYLFHKYGITTGRILDPFAGSGTALFAASAMGINADGIELLPIGREIVTAKQILDAKFTPEDFERLRWWSTLRPWERSEARVPLAELRITQGAYPEKTKEAIERYIGASRQESEKVQAVLRFALLCVLESISFTRKDGQYLRWDYRSGRTHGKKAFDKGEIPEFGQAISEKINEILEDVSPAHQATLFPTEKLQGQIRFYEGSCFHVLPQLPANTYDAIMTSPPYCNRYDYTRTYALELALLGVDEQRLSHLRQEMISCTVENRAKDLLNINPQWAVALAAADEQELLQAILKYLEDQKARRALNNNGIPRMVRGYFYEMACVIAESARVLKPNALLFMVNDNVRYAGVSISVDMILSEIAEKLGFRVEHILVLPDEKGNSSQQMGEHGREPLRKCIYVWRKI